MTELPDLFIHGIDLLNRGKYFEAHEAIEAAWRSEKGSIRTLYQGILQVAVVYYHISNRNYTGARKVIKHAITNLSEFMDSALFDVPGIIRNLNEINDYLERSKPDEFNEINPALLKPVTLHR